MSYKEIKLSTTGICELIGGEDESAIFRILPSTTVKLAGNNVIIQLQADRHVVEFDDKINARMEYERLADYIAEEADLPQRGRRYIGLRDVDFIQMGVGCIPERRTDGSAGYDCKVDLEAVKQIVGIRVLDNVLTLEPGQFFLAPLGFKLHIGDPDFEAQLRPRSGKGSKGLVLGNMIGTIDSDYQGQYMACLWNRLDKPLEVDLTEPVCQLVFSRVEHPRFNETTEFLESDRGEGGFGSTDIKKS
jgi:dUTP pyrophosphatase